MSKIGVANQIDKLKYKALLLTNIFSFGNLRFSSLRVTTSVCPYFIAFITNLGMIELSH